MSTQSNEPPVRQRDERMPLVLVLLLVVIGVQLYGLVLLSGKVNDLQGQVVMATSAASSANAAAGPVVTTDPTALDACRLLGGLAVKAGLSITTLFRDEPVVGGCETAAYQGAHLATSAG